MISGGAIESAKNIHTFFIQAHFEMFKSTLSFLSADYVNCVWYSALSFPVSRFGKNKFILVLCLAFIIQRYLWLSEHRMCAVILARKSKWTFLVQTSSHELRNTFPTGFDFKIRGYSYLSTESVMSFLMWKVLFKRNRVSHIGDCIWSELPWKLFI